MKLIIAIAGGLAALAISAWVYISSVTTEDLLRADDMAEFNRYASIVSLRGAKAIPIFLDVLDDSLKKRYSVFNYGKINSSISHLYNLANRGITDVRSVPVLIRVIDEQIFIKDTLPTAEILYVITGVGSGYDKKFVETYTEKDEKVRQEMIGKWREWYASGSPQPPNPRIAQ
ncbi:MAG: hypothetical protein AB1421_12455 [Pseudomonadota bacterium]